MLSVPDVALEVFFHWEITPSEDRVLLYGRRPIPRHKHSSDQPEPDELNSSNSGLCSRSLCREWRRSDFIWMVGVIYVKERRTHGDNNAIRAGLERHGAIEEHAWRNV